MLTSYKATLCCKERCFTFLLLLSVSGEYSCLTVDMTFKRQIAYYLFTIYFPTVIIVFSSWMSFWLDHKSVRIACDISILDY